MKVLCAVDGSTCALRTLDALGTLFYPSLQEIVLVHVLDTSLLERGPKKEGPATRQAKKLLMAVEADGKNILKAAEAHIGRVCAQRVGMTGATIRSVLLKGHVAYALVKEAEKRKPDLIAIGARGFQDIKGYVMGSVSRKVLAHAPCPVLIVKEPLRAPVKLVLAVDSSTASTRAATYVRSLIASDAVSVHVFSVVPHAFGGAGSGVAEPYMDALRDALHTQAQGKTALVRTQLVKKKFKVTSEVVQGNPRTAILDCLVQRDAGLAVLGAKGLTGPERFHMGSVSEWVVAHSGCSMLVVRPKIR